MRKKAEVMRWRKWFIIVATFVLCIVGLGAAQAFAAAPYVPVFTTNNNLSITDSTNTTASGGNDIWFTWDGTLKTSVAVSGQVTNATLASYGSGCFTGTGGTKWVAHDLAVYGPGTYTVFASCAAKAPGCAGGTSPITFTVGASEIGVHMLVDWGTVSTNKNIDVVDVWTPGVFSPSPMYTGACGAGNASQVWDLMSRPSPATPTINGYAMVDGPFIGTRWNFNLMGPLINRTIDTPNNNFTMIDGTGLTFGGTNDVRFTWDGTQKTAVSASGQVPNASLSSGCAFFAHTWAAHDVAVYGPGTYTIFDGCAAGSPGCGTGNPVTFTVNAGELGAHMLFFWNGSDNIDVVDVWQPNLPFLPSVMCDNTTAGFVYGCGTNPLTTVWDHMSYDWTGVGINGAPMTDGPFLGSFANFNVMGNLAAGCVPANCDDNNACTADSCVNNVCVHTPIVCNDNSVCTTDTCVPATGCVFTPISCDDNNICTSDSCDPVSGCQHAAIVPASCNDNNACTADGCTANACTHTAIVCNDNNACTTDTCNTATGCVFTPIVCNDNLACTTDSCNTATGCVFTDTCPSGQICTATGCSSAPCTSNAMCNDNNACTTDTCNTATGACSNTAITCNDNDACTTDTCNTATGCVFTPIVCNDNNACTTDSCNTATGCVFTPIVCNDNLACTTDSCNTATGCVFTNTCPSGQLCTATGCSSAPCTSNAMCNDNNACTTDTCNTATGACSNTAITCNDNNACTTDTCNTATGCVFTPIVCNDNNACTTDTCNSATGCVFTPIVCNDNLACTTDSCNTATGCVFTNTCPSGQLCTATGCSSALCTSNAMCNDNNACTTDTCNTATGACSNTAITCDDNNACTTDTCNTATGCVFTPIVCNDNNACTTDTCNTASGCVFTPIVCNDNNLCTTDTCNTATGCVFTPVSCSTGQTCDPTTGNCVGVNPCTGKICNDNNACTTDTCDTATGNCVFTPISCDDNNACTTDTCNTATGCVHTPIPGCGVVTDCTGLQDGTPCDDGNLCTVNDRCDDGVCKGRPKNCHRSDHDKCTIESCEPETGNCVHTPIPGCQSKKDVERHEKEG